MGGLAVLAAFLLLAPPLYFLAPFAVLMVLAGPRAPREVLALLAAVAGLVVALSGGTTLGPGLLKASAVALALGFGLASLRPRGPVLARAGLALLLAALAIGVWCWMRGIYWPDVERAFTAMLVETYQAVPGLSRDPATQEELKRFVGPILEAAPGIARALPGLLALQALAGMGLAALWQHRIARHPAGPPPVPFRQFRFNDHLIWGAIFTLALWLVPLPPEGRALALNLLVVWAGLYGFRGLAVFAALLAPAPVLLRVLAAGLAVLLNPIALGTCVAIGLADTWFDIRGRFLPPASEGTSR
ncbi:MAG TPA: DUF2232 domain-containing protein [Gemmatimonadales bacterium]|nr:DUF2232 domain-containing protein [Gemmatimonadales bacterium]